MCECRRVFLKTFIKFFLGIFTHRVGAAHMVGAAGIPRYRSDAVVSCTKFTVFDFRKVSAACIIRLR